MPNHYQWAEQVLNPPSPRRGDPGVRGRAPAGDPAAAQVHAMLAVADQLSRIADALEQLAGRQPESR